ncbi:MAG: putative photosynthetic complex assembly protein PuhE [Gammaproteobacteria bacterium]
MAAAVTYAAFLWWFTTGVVLWLCGRPRASYRWSLAGATLLLAVALVGLYVSSRETTAPSAFLAFTCAVVVWGWHEISYYMGLVTGPRPAPLRPGSGGWQRFSQGIATSLYHDLAIVCTGLALLALTADSPNRVGAWTFLVLWVMRWSAKLNLFLGVPNLNEDFLPPHLRYLATYMRRRAMNPLFPVSVTAGTGVVVWLVYPVAAGASAFDGAAAGLVATLLALAVLEHWFMVLPMNEAALWGWGFKSRKTPASPRALDAGRS